MKTKEEEGKLRWGGNEGRRTRIRINESIEEETRRSVLERDLRRHIRLSSQPSRNLLELVDRRPSSSTVLSQVALVERKSVDFGEGLGARFSGTDDGGIE
jgi:hypothetical protein